METLGMLLLQEGPAETTGYMILGYALIFSALLLHLASLALRRRSLEEDLRLLEELQKED